MIAKNAENKIKWNIIDKMKTNKSQRSDYVAEKCVSYLQQMDDFNFRWFNGTELAPSYCDVPYYLINKEKSDKYSYNKCDAVETSVNSDWIFHSLNIDLIRKETYRIVSKWNYILKL